MDLTYITYIYIYIYKCSACTIQARQSEDYPFAHK